MTKLLGRGIPVRKGKSKIKLSTIKSKIVKTSFLSVLFCHKEFSWCPKARDKNGTEGLKWYRNMILGDRAQGNQKITNPNEIKNKFKAFFLIASIVVSIIAALPAQKTTGLPEAKILAILSF